MVATIYGAEQDVYAVGTQQKFDIGQKMETPDGDVFRFTLMGSTIGIANKLYQSSIPIGNWADTDITVAMAVGDTTISFTDGGTAFVVDEAAGGSLHPEDPADLGHVYRVKSNLATASNETIMTLENGVTVQVAIAVVANNALTFIKNPWRQTIISPATINTAPNCGVSRVIIAANGFGWTQVRGVASCLFDTDATGGALLLGHGCRAATDIAGAVTIHDEAAGDAEYQNVGYALETVADTMFGHIFLTLG